jgi:hypothetical protein
MNAPQPSTSTAPRPITIVGVLATVALLIAPAAPAGGLNRLLPDEDRRAMAELESASETEADALVLLLIGDDMRLFDLLPPVEEAPESEDDLHDEPGDDTADTFHVVRAGEGLADIAAAYDLHGLDDWRRIYDANPDLEDPDLVEVGTRLRIPAPDEELARRELPAPPPPRPGARAARGGGGDVWDRLAACESGGNWAANTGNGYYGGLQFSARSWAAVGGSGLPHEHGRGTQIAMAERLRAAQGWGAWPSCSRRLGLR